MFQLARLTLLFVLALFIGAGCSSGDLSNYTLYESDWCVVQGKGSQITLFTDSKEILKPSESLDSLFFKAGDRYRAFYIPLGNPAYSSMVSGSKLVEIANLQPVLVANAMPRVSFTGSANDIIWLNSGPFFGGGFLNFDFQFYSTESGIKHGIYLLEDSLVNRKVYLRFAHDAHGDAVGHTASALASFPLSSLKMIGGADSLIIVYKMESGWRANRLALRDTL